MVKFEQRPAGGLPVERSPDQWVVVSVAVPERKVLLTVGFAGSGSVLMTPAVARDLARALNQHADQAEGKVAGG